MIITTAAHKGGTGKTTCAVMFALLLAQLGPTVIVDADRQRSATTWLDEAREDGWVLPESLTVTTWQDGMSLPPRDLGHYVIDTGPGDPERLQAALTLSTHAVVVMGARRADVAHLMATVADVEQAAERRHDTDPLSWGVLLTMVRARTHEANDVPTAVLDAGLPLVPTTIPARADFLRLYGTAPEPAGRGPWAYYADVLQWLTTDETDETETEEVPA